MYSIGLRLPVEHEGDWYDEHSTSIFQKKQFDQCRGTFYVQKV